MKQPGSPAEAQAQFVGWVRARHPSLYAAAKRSVEADELAGLGSTGTQMGPPNITTTGNALFDKIAKLGDQYLTLTSQKMLFDQNLRAVREGKSPKRTAIPPAPIAAPTYGDSFMDRLNALPLAVKLGAVAGLGYLVYRAIKR